MKEYSLDSLGESAFEHLIQSLCEKIFGIECKIYGDGPDGQREAVYEGIINENLLGRQMDGKTFIQAKFKNTRTNKKDFLWIKDFLDDEFERFRQKKKDGGSYLPDNYIFFTNVKLTAVKEIGTKDKVDKLIQQYIDIIPNITIVSYDEICALLDNNRDVATSYASFILSGDILSELYEMLMLSKKQSLETILDYLSCEFVEDQQSRMEQAGQVSDNHIKLEKVFVDLGLKMTLDTAWMSNSVEDDLTFVKFFTEYGNECFRSKERQSNNKFVLIGGAGQGKSTLSQFLAQIYRTHFLDHFAKSTPLTVGEFLNTLQTAQEYYLKCLRIPIRIILKDYAEWITKRDNLPTSLLTYIQDCVYKKTNKNLDPADLDQLLKKYSWLFIFDGLDEIPASSNKVNVLKEIEQFVGSILPRNNCDSIVICTTRPQGYTDDFDNNAYTHIELEYMNDDICLEYFSRLFANMDESKSKQEQFLASAKQALADKMISRLMRTPLQATIIAILIKSGGDLPHDRFNLFSSYYDTIIRRESQKQIIETLNDNLNWIDDIHFRLAFSLQSESENQTNASATISTDDFMKILEKYISQKLDPELYKKSDIKKKVEQIFTIILKRLTFVAEIQDGKIGFYIRSLQEYFSARYITKNRTAKEITSYLEAIARCTYWRNVFLFALGEIETNHLYLEKCIDSLCGEMNGAGLQPDRCNVDELCFAGSWLALDILIESIFKSDYTITNKYFGHAQKLLMQDTTKGLEVFLKLSESMQKKFLKSYLYPLLKNKTIFLTGWYVLGIFMRQNNKESFVMAEELWELNNDRQNEILRMFVEDIRLSNNWITQKMIKYTESNGELFFLDVFQYRRMASYIKTEEQKGILFLLILYSISNRNSAIYHDNEFFCKDILMSVIDSKIFDRDYGNSREIVENLKISIYDQPLNDTKLEALDNLASFCSLCKLAVYEKMFLLYKNPTPENFSEFVSIYGEQAQASKKAIIQISNKIVSFPYISKAIGEIDKVQRDVVIENFSLMARDFQNVYEYTKQLYDDFHIKDFKYLSPMANFTYTLEHSKKNLNKFVAKFEPSYDELSSYTDAFKTAFLFTAGATAQQYLQDSKAELDKQLQMWSYSLCNYYDDGKYKKHRYWIEQLYMYHLLSCDINELGNKTLNYYVFTNADFITDMNKGVVYRFDSLRTNYIIDKFLKCLIYNDSEILALRALPHIIKYFDFENLKLDGETKNIVDIPFKDDSCRLGKLVLLLMDPQRLIKQPECIINLIQSSSGNEQFSNMVFLTIQMADYIESNSQYMGRILCEIYSMTASSKIDKSVKTLLLSKIQTLSKKLSQSQISSLSCNDVWLDS